MVCLRISILSKYYEYSCCRGFGLSRSICFPFYKQTITGGLKTDAGKDRVIPIHPKIFKHIKAWYDKNGEYLICNDKGKHISDKKYREDFYYPALEKLEIRKLNPHCCRHTFSSLMRKAVLTLRLSRN